MISSSYSQSLGRPPSISTPAMADPLSVFGGVAASVQLVGFAAGAFIKTIRLVKQLEEIPRKTACQLDDVNSSSQKVQFFCHQLNDNLSPLIGSELLPRLMACANKLQDALNEAQHLLEPLVSGHVSTKGRPIKRLYNAAVSVVQERAISERLRRVETLNQRMFEELLIASLYISFVIPIQKRYAA